MYKNRKAILHKFVSYFIWIHHHHKGPGKMTSYQAENIFKKYLHALSNHIFCGWPHARFKWSWGLQTGWLQIWTVFQVLRRNRLSKKDWVNIKWQPGKITHTFQKDCTSCGVFVMQMAKMTVMELPNIPEMFDIDPSKQSVQNLRRDMAEEILNGLGRFLFLLWKRGLAKTSGCCLDSVWNMCKMVPHTVPWNDRNTNTKGKSWPNG